MKRGSLLLSAVAALAFVPAACSDRSSPVALGSAGNPSLSRNRDFDNGDTDEQEGLLRLVSVIGPGHGWIRATRVPHPTVPGNFAVHIEARVRHAKPNTTYLVQRAAETFNPAPPSGFPASTTTDGSCQRGLAIAPWSTLVPAQPAFATFSVMGFSTTFTTDAEGNGETDFVFAATIPLPLFDVMFRVLESGPAPQSALQTDCTVVPLI